VILDCRWSPELTTVDNGMATPGNMVNDPVWSPATLEEITYDMGDGRTVTCAGQDAPGTVYQESFGASESPTCGHTYTQPSPEGGYTITATSSWTIEWDGGGENGMFTTDFTASTGYKVGELQALRGTTE